jgi:hypothetical protein
MTVAASNACGALRQAAQWSALPDAGTPDRHAAALPWAGRLPVPQACGVAQVTHAVQGEVKVLSCTSKGRQVGLLQVPWAGALPVPEALGWVHTWKMH